MKLFISLLFLSFYLCASVLAKDGIHFSGNVTENPDDDHHTAVKYDLQFRTVTFVKISAEDSPPAGGFLFRSSEVSAPKPKPTPKPKRDEAKHGSDDDKGNHTHSESEESDDDHDHDDHGVKRGQHVTIVGGAAVSGLNGLFTTYLAGFRNGDKKAYDFQKYNSDISSSLGFVISALLNLQEIDANNNTVVNASLSGLGWTFSDVQTDTTGSLFTISASATVAASASSSGFSINITFLASKVVGKTDFANAVVTPKTIESVISLSGYTLESSENSLALVFLAASGSSKVSAGVGLVSGTTFASGDYSDGSLVFFSLSDSCYVNNSTTSSPVTINTRSVTRASDKAEYESLSAFAAVRGRYSNKMTLTILQVVFPANATSIVYDPTTGSGQVITQAAETSAAAHTHTHTTHTHALWVALVVCVSFVVLNV